MHVEDQTAPIKREVIKQSIDDPSCVTTRSKLVERLMGYLNEKRDSYNGVISSLIYMIDANDEELIDLLKSNLQEYIAADPMRYGGKIFVTRCLSRLINERPQFVASFFTRFLVDQYRAWEDRIPSQSEVIRIKIIALKAISQVEQKKGVKMSEIPDMMIDAICDEAIMHGDETTKIDTLYILLDTKSATKVIGPRELDIFCAVFKETLNFQVPALRQKFLAITNKLLKRIRDSTRVVHREKTRFSDLDRKTITSRYMNFLEWLIEFCLDNIYCNKYFGSFIITMTTLSYIIEHITLSNANLPIAPFLEKRRFYDSILSCLALDSFEDNKVMALKLLFALPNSEPIFCEENLKLFEKIAYELVNSVNPAHTMTCQYIFKLMIGIRQGHTKTKKNLLLYDHLDRLVSLVEAGVQETKEDYISAMKSNAIYPKLTCIRALLDEINVRELNDDRERWEQLAERLVQASIGSSEAVSSIVCNMNPETIGHLPMDLKPIDANILSKNANANSQISENNLNTITSQHLLITGWKTIKECSLSLGAMCSIFWWPECDRKNLPGEPILAPNQVRAIIDFFEHYLRNLRHRGAFEQAYNGFVMVTKRLWLDEKFKSILIDNLNVIMNDFKSGQYELGQKKVDYLKKHVTRRSAGLPFLVQAIAVSEHKHDSVTFRSIMNSLISVSNSADAEAYQKIHCLNILKALVNDFNLGEKVTPYVGQVLLITIDAFRSDNFSIRNCANMLMRALVDRTFGVSRLRDEIHKRNTMSFEKFFTQYPDLHVRFVTYLKDGLEDRRSFAAVHAVFIVLSRLRPSLNPSPNHTIERLGRPFLEPIMKLACECPDFKLRELAAKLYVQLKIYLFNEQPENGPVHDMGEQINKFIKSVTDNDWYSVDRNMFHGCVSILKSWLELETEIKDPNLRLQLHTIIVRFLVTGITDHSYPRSKYHNQVSAQIINSWTVTLDLMERLYVTQEDHPTVRDATLYLLRRINHILDGTKCPYALVCRNFICRNGCLCKDGEPFREPTWTFPTETGPMLENFIFRIICQATNKILLESSVRERHFNNITDMITRKPNRHVGVNLQAAVIRFLRQSLSFCDDFTDKLMDNLDLDSTAAHMTPVDKLNQHSELDSEKEIWVRYCGRTEIRDLVSKELPGKCLNKIFDLSKYEEFEQIQCQEIKELNLTLANSPRAIELLALVLKGWNCYNLEERCIWSREGESNTDKLRFLIKFIHLLPDCDVKCLVLLCASKYFKIELLDIHSLCDVSQDSNQIPLHESPFQALADQVEIMTQFTVIVEDLADGQHDRMTRETCGEILSANLETVIECWCKPLKEAHMNLLSALVKLCQDESYEIRQAGSRVLSSLSSFQPEENSQLSSTESRLGNLIVLISTRLLDPSNKQDVLIFFELLSRIIFNHTKNTLFDVNEERESLFDKTKPNIFADHVATIHEALIAASAFFKHSKEKNLINLDSISLPPEVLEELLAPEIQGQVDHSIGDYSWRLKSGFCAKLNELTEVENNNRNKIDSALITVKQSLSYFNHWNMLTDTSFGYHESSTFKKLAFIKLLIECTDYSNEDLINGTRESLKETISSSCATTILFKCHELFK